MVETFIEECNVRNNKDKCRYVFASNLINSRYLDLGYLVASNVTKCIIQLLRELHHKLSEHQGFHVDAEGVENLPVSHVKESVDLIHGLEDLPLLGCPGPQQSSPNWGSYQEDCAVQQGES